MPRQPPNFSYKPASSKTNVVVPRTTNPALAAPPNLPDKSKGQAKDKGQVKDKASEQGKPRADSATGAGQARTSSDQKEPSTPDRSQRNYYIVDLGEMHQPIAEALMAAGVPSKQVRYVNPLSHWFHGNSERGLFKRGDVVLNHVGPEDCPEGSGKREAIYSLLSILSNPSRGLHLVHDERVFEIDCSKVAQIKLAEKHGLNVPSTEIILANKGSRDRQCLLEASDAVRHAPTSRGFFLKPSCGGTGKGVVHFRDRDALVSACDHQGEEQLFPHPGVYLLQEDVNPDRNTLYRLEIVGGQPYYWLQIDSRYSFDLCPNCVRDKKYRVQANRRMTLNPSSLHLEKPSFRIYQPSSLPAHFKQAQEQCVTLLKEAGATNAGFEFAARVIDGEPSLVCLDINFSSNYNREAELHATSDPQPNAYEQLARHLISL